MESRTPCRRSRRRHPDRGGGIKYATYLLTLVLALPAADVFAQSGDFTAVRAEVNFAKVLRPWDGFGDNYVETSQTFDYERWPRDYGGFCFLCTWEVKKGYHYYKQISRAGQLGNHLLRRPVIV